VDCHVRTWEPYPRSAVAHGGIYQFRVYRENPDAVQVALEYGQGVRKFMAQYSVSQFHRTETRDGRGNGVETAIGQR
jgi:hypothetical protein